MWPTTITSESGKRHLWWLLTGLLQMRPQSTTTGGNLQLDNGGGSSHPMPLRWIASRGDSRTTQAIIFTDSTNFLRKVKSGMGSPDLNVSMVDIHLRKICGCNALVMPGWREMTEPMQWRAKPLSRVGCFSEDLKRWRAWDTTCGTKPRTWHRR